MNDLHCAQFLLLEVLRLGILQLRDMGVAHRADHGVMADHLHNLPEIFVSFEWGMAVFYCDATRSGFRCNAKASRIDLEVFKPIWNELDRLLDQSREAARYRAKPMPWARRPGNGEVDEIKATLGHITQDALLICRSLGWRDQVDVNGVEAEHIINIPRTIQDFHWGRVVNYCDVDRPSYKRMSLNAVDRFDRHWERLDRLVDQSADARLERKMLADLESQEEGDLDDSLDGGT